LGKNENLNHSIYLWEINCAEKKGRIPSAFFHDNKGGVIDSLGDPSLKWCFISPGPMAEK
jgi:hypothetical protein